MANISKRMISLLLVIILMLMNFSAVDYTVDAAGFPTTHPNTHKNTGNGAVDITEIAKTQVGYKENYVGTKYGDWYNGYFVNQPWCAMFVSWCAVQAGISQDIIKSFAACSVGVRWFQSQGVWHDSAYYGGDYIPKKGDIIFYRNNGSSNLSDHVGIVLGVNGQYINVIEGNSTNESCCEFKTNSARTLTNKYVIGYASPRYLGSSIDVTEDEPTTYENWQVTDADTLSLRQSYTTDSKRLAKIPRGTLLEVTEFQPTEDYLWGYTEYDEQSGWCALDYCVYINGNIDGVYYQPLPKFTTENMTVFVGEEKKTETENTLTVTYFSSDKSIVKVGAKGKITGVAPGTTTILCTTPTGTATCNVTVVSAQLDTPELTTCIGDTCKMSFTGAYEPMTYSVKKENIATVDENGVITGVAEGKTKVFAITASNVKYKCIVKVNKEPSTYERFTVVQPNVYLKTDYQGSDIVLLPEETLLKITEVKYSDTLTWGKTLYGNNEGWVILNYCDYMDGSIDGVRYKVRPYLTETKKTLYVGDTYTIMPENADGESVFESKKPHIVSVDEKGVVKALGAGKSNVFIANGDTVMKCRIIVKAPTLSRLMIDMGRKERIPLAVNGGSGDIKWKSADKTVAKVTAEGVVIGKGFGTTTITAKRNGVVMECVVNVYDPIFAEENLEIKIGEKKFLTITQNYSDEIIWSTSNKKIVGISQKGKIKGKLEGSAGITAIADGKTIKCTVTVTK